MAATHMLLHLLSFLPLILGFDTSFIHCMSKHSASCTSNYTYSPHSPSYFNLLQSVEHNLRWINSTSSRPKLVVTPYSDHQIKAAINCAKKHGLQIRVVSGGHDYEGLSYQSKTPFVLVDLINLRSIEVDLKRETAWVQAGATLGELYYSIAQKSSVHGFPGGGIGTLVRKYGLAADNIIDARFMNSQGQVVDRESMGENLFWALRGGGGASFGVILAWKVKLVRVPPVVTVFTIRKNLDEEGIEVANKWQNIASILPQDLFIRVLLINTKKMQNSSARATAFAYFDSLFLGNMKRLLAVMNTRFPELGLKEKDCSEMSWINSTLYFSANKGKPLEALLVRGVNYSIDRRFKGKSDFVYKPLPKSVYGGIKERLVREGSAFVIMDPFGGKMEQIGESELPFPHRKGNLFNIQYLFKWDVDDEAKKHLDWISEMYEFMEPYVSSSPRAAYLNYKDLDIGLVGFNHNNNTSASYQEAAVWGFKYFKGNFERLAKVKKAVDPANFFRNEQSIPPIS